MITKGNDTKVQNEVIAQTITDETAKRLKLARLFPKQEIKENSDYYTYFRQNINLDEAIKKGLLGEAFDALAKETDNEKANVVFGYTTDLLKSAEEQITKGIENRGFTLLAKEDVLSYNNLLSKDDSSLVKASAVILADGYKMFRNDTKYLVALGEKTSAKAFIQIYIDFCKTVVNGIGKNGEMTACVEIKFTIYGEDGKVIKMVNGYASNPDTIPVVAGVYNVEKLNALFPVALEEAVKKVCEKL